MLFDTSRTTNQRGTGRIITLAAALFFLAQGLTAQDIRTNLTVFDNIGNSQVLTVGINPSATDGIDGGLGEAMLGPAPPPGNFDARLIDTDLRSPSLLGNGVVLDLRGIFTTPPITYTFEVRARRAAAATNTWMAWTLPFSIGISAARVVSYPDPSIVNVDMFATNQILLPVGTNRYFVTVTYGGPPIPRYTLNTQVAPAGKGSITIIPNQPDYAQGTLVTLTANNLPAPDTCYVFSHWSGDASGTNPTINVTMNNNKNITANYARRKFPVTVSSLSPFIVNPGTPPPQSLIISNSGLACYDWTATATQPWINISPSSGIGNGVITVSINTAALPCPGMHAGSILITSDASNPTTIPVPVTAQVGSASLSANTIGNPTILSCQPKANDLIIVSVYNGGLSSVTFPSAPAVGPGFVLKNPLAFPMTIPPADTGRLYYEFAPLTTQQGLIVENVILSASGCGQQVLFQLRGTRIAPTVTADVFELDFGNINACPSDPLPSRSIVLNNAYSQTAQLRYQVPTGFVLTTAPASIGGMGTQTVSIEPTRLGAAQINCTLIIEADFGVCTEIISVALTGKRQNPSFRAEAVATPGSLPPQLFDTTCVGSYSQPKAIRIINDGTADLIMTLAIAPPFEIDAFSTVFALPAGEQRVINVRFHPTTGGSFSQVFSMTANQCALTQSVTLEGHTFSQQILASNVSPASVTLANCDPGAKVRISIISSGTQPAVFHNLPALPSGFVWDAGITLPVIVNPGVGNPFEAFINFQPPVGQGGIYGGSVQWFGEPCGTSVYFILSGERVVPQVTVSTLDTFVVNQTAPTPQKLYLTNTGGLSCYKWSASAAAPWIRLSKLNGMGDDSITVSIITSAIPCQGTHATTITITLDGQPPVVLNVPVLLRVGRSTLSATTMGSPVLLSCQPKANDLLVVTIFNSGAKDILFPAPPAVGQGFALKNAGSFPLVVPSGDSSRLFFEFAPSPNQRGLISENVVLTASECGQQVLFTLTGIRIAPTVTTNSNLLDFGLINACPTDPLPTRNLTLTNNHTQAAQLRYEVPNGIVLVTAPSSVSGGGTQTVSLQAQRTGSDSIKSVMRIEADFGVCQELFFIDLVGKRQNPSFFVEAVNAPGTLPPQLFDTTCVGGYSAPKSLRIVNNGTADMQMTLTIAAPFEIDAFNNVFQLKAGEEKIIAIRFHPVTSGAFNQTLTIASNLCNLSATVALRGHTFSQQLLASNINPTSVTLVNCEPNAKIRVTITNTGTAPAIFRSLPDLPSGFEWDSTITLPIVIVPGAGNPFDGYILFNPPTGEGNQFGGSVQWFGEPCGTSVYFSLSGERVLPRVTLTPGQIDFGVITDCGSGSSTPVQTITLQNNSPLPITVTASAPIVRYSIFQGATPFPSQGVAVPSLGRLDISVQARLGTGGPFVDSLYLNVLAGSGGICTQTLPVALIGERYKPGYLVREEDASADFGDVCLNSSSTRMFVIANTGDKTLNVTSSPLPVGSPFAFLASPFRVTVGAGQSKAFPIRYNPTATGQHSANLIFTDDVCLQPVTFVVRGRGVKPQFSVTDVTPPLDVLTCETPLSKQLKATVNNTGSDPITITDGSVLPLGFAYDPPGQFPFTLQSGESKDLGIRFVETNPGTYSGVVTLSSAPCDGSISFPISVILRHTAFTVTPSEATFNDITVCPGGNVRDEDIERLTTTIEVRNTGTTPLTIGALIKPSNSPIRLFSPIDSVFGLAPGASQTITFGLTPPIDSALSFFNGSVNFIIVRDQRCLPEVAAVPFAGRVLRVKYQFAQDTVKGISTCSNEPVEMQARLVNNGTTITTFALSVEGSAAFSLVDSSKTLTIQPGSSSLVTVRYTPNANQSTTAVLRAMDTRCRYEAIVPLMILLSEPEVTISCSPVTGGSAALTGRPGDVVEIPVFLRSGLECTAPNLELNFDVRFNVYSLSPRQVVSLQGEATFKRVAPDRIRVTVSRAPFVEGELTRVQMEVLVGRTAQAGFSITNAEFQPSLALVTLDESCDDTIAVKARDGVTTLADLGINPLAAPRPNVLSQNGPQRTEIGVTIPTTRFVELKVFNQLGSEVVIVYRGNLEAGSHSLFFTPPSDLPSGLYLISLNDGQSISTQKLILAR